MVSAGGGAGHTEGGPHTHIVTVQGAGPVKGGGRGGGGTSIGMLGHSW